MTAVDTNVLIYTVDPRDPRKQCIAKSVLAGIEGGVLLWQVACEYFSATRKLVPFGLTPNAASDHLNALRQVWKMSYPSWELLMTAREYNLMNSVSFWDAMILAACDEARITTLYSEDINPNMVRIPRLTIINPFI